NPVLASLGGAKCAPAAAQTTYLWQGTPFARSSAALGLEATRHPGEWAALSRLSGEIDLMERYSATWQQRLTGGLAGMRAEDAAARKCIEDLREAAAQAPEAQQVTVLAWPWEPDSVAVRMLLTEALGEESLPLMTGAFSERLTVMPSCPADALADPVLQQACQVQFAQPTEPCGVLPPLSEAAAKLVAEGTTLMPDSFRIIHEQQETGEERTHASFALQGKRTVVFTRIYDVDEVCVLTAEDIPAVAVWPSVPFPKDRWQAYYVLAQDASGIEALALSGGVWHTGESRSRGSAAWTVQQTKTYPACISLRMDGRSIGALPNLLPPFEPAVRGSAAISLDFGVSGTAVVIRIGDEILPMGGASLTRTLLHGTNLPALTDAVIAAPEVPAILPSVLAVTAEGVRPLLDGFICQMNSAGESAAFDLKWLSGETREQVWRLYLGQVMLTASLTAVLRGADDVTWRVAMPDGMAPEGRAALARCIHLLAEETAARTGLGLTANMPAATFATESLAVGTYFRLRNEVNLKGGLTTLDLGAGSATMSVWLRGQNRPAAVCTMPLGVQMLLMDCLLAEPRLLTDCLNDSVSPGLWAAASSLRSHAQQARGNMKALRRARLSLEDCFSHHTPELFAQMRSAPGCTRLEALLLWRLSQVMTCCGLMLEQVYQNPNVNHLLPGVMPVAVSGRGALLMQGMDPARQARLWRMLMLPMSRNHPVRELFPLATPEPKLETVTGLAQLEDLPDFPEPAESYIPLGVPATPPVMLVPRFVATFRMEFPDAMEALLPGAFLPNGAFTPQLETLLQGLIVQYFPQGIGMQAQYMACLNALVQAWTPPEGYPGAGVQYN
ncbi:MAG: hypothetical protein IKK21_08300, partial [Clostridia bacterium]|nr:hypothetical protein [Clostridia bacterium]